MATTIAPTSPTLHHQHYYHYPHVNANVNVNVAQQKQHPSQMQAQAQAYGQHHPVSHASGPSGSGSGSSSPHVPALGRSHSQQYQDDRAYQFTHPQPQPGRSASSSTPEAYRVSSDINSQYSSPILPSYSNSNSHAQPQPPHLAHPHPHSHSHHSPSPSLDWQAQAGPSSRRRPPSDQSYISHNPPDVQQRSRRSSPQHGGAGAGAVVSTRQYAEHMDIDAVESRTRGLMIANEDEGDGRVGVGDPFGERSYSELKCLGDGSFGTVWLCDWHSPVKPGVLLSAMQCGAGARPEWAGKRLVALKRMKRVWDGGWKQASTLGELASLRRIPQHPAIIPLYDAFISPKSHELYFVFECMEGNLYQLTKSRRGRPLAAGLIASCFHQITSGLHHIHRHGYFHRDMKPENLLVTTTGLTDYLTPAALNHINATRGSSAGSDEPLSRSPTGSDQHMYEKDVSVIVKLADFGLARETSSKPPYTEYVSTRWYRAPEVLLRSTEYGPPVDMWALGTILAEMLNLKPLFPGVSEIDQVYRICDTLGDPSSEYGVDERGRTIGGGSWNTGIKLAKNVGFSFPKRKPVNFRGLFNERVPQSLVDCIGDLLRYNPKYRMTSAQCIEHPYFHETITHLQRTPPLPRIPFSQGQPHPGARPQPTVELAAPPRQIPPSHSHAPQEPRPAFANGDMRTLPPPVSTPDALHNRMFLPAQTGFRQEEARLYGSSALVNQLRELDLPTEDLSSYGNRLPPSPIAKARAEQRKEPLQVQTQWLEEPAAYAGRRPSMAQTLYDGSVFEGSQASASASNASFSHYNTLSAANLRHQEKLPPSHVTAYVQQQQQMALQNQQSPITSPDALMPPPIEPTQGASRAPATIGKKKKWGLSSVFGGGDKSNVSLASVPESGYTSSANLKRTQSGHSPADRISPVSTISPMSATTASTSATDDPKKAKKEAEKRAKELELAKREAAARAQKERARAVMQKRNHLVETRAASKQTADLEYSAMANTARPGAIPSPVVETPVSGISSASQLHMASSSARSPSHQSISPSSLSISHSTSAASASTPSFPTQPRTYASMPPSASLSSIRSLESGRSHHSGQSGQSQQLSASALAAYDAGLAGRHKARRRNEDDDHSMSSFDVNSLRSRSALTVGTIDSDPGPRRARDAYPDPLIAAAQSRRAPSASASSYKRHRSPSRLMSGSNPSVDSQLARDFMNQASVASPTHHQHSSASLNTGANSSSTSLGRHGTSQLSLHGDMPVPPLPVPVPISGTLPVSLGPSLGAVHDQGHYSPYRHDPTQSQHHPHGQGSAPTSPYGHPKGIAVAHGIGVGRPSVDGGGGETWLPRIEGLEGGDPRDVINPMFRVPPAQQHPSHIPSTHGGGGKSTTTLPPFASIASVADHNPPHRQ